MGDSNQAVRGGNDIGILDHLLSSSERPFYISTNHGGSIPVERAELLAAVEAGWTEWQGLLGILTPEQMIEPVLPGGWSVKDAIAHIAFYEWWVGEFIRTRTRPQAPHPSLDTFDMHARNDAFYELNKHRALDDVLEESHRVHQVLVDAVTALTEAEYHDRNLLGTPPDDEWRVEKMVDGNTFLHYPEHAAVVREQFGLA
jgi:hypothetical protein